MWCTQRPIKSDCIGPSTQTYAPLTLVVAAGGSCLGLIAVSQHPVQLCQPPRASAAEDASSPIAGTPPQLSEFVVKAEFFNRVVFPEATRRNGARAT